MDLLGQPKRNMSNNLEKDNQILKRSAAYFYDRLFIRCKALTTQIISNEHQTSPCVEWIAENNTLAAEYELILMKGKESVHAEFYVRFQNLLKKIKSLPMTRENKELELSVLFNCLVISQHSTTGSDNLHCLITEFFNRLAVYSGLSLTGNAPSLLEKLSSEGCQLKGMLQLCLLWAVSLIRSGNYNTAQQILIPVTSTQSCSEDSCSHQQGCQNPSEFAVKLHQGSPPLTQKDAANLIHILLASCKLAEDTFDHRRTGQLTNLSNYSPLCHYIDALGLYKQESFKEALNALQKMKCPDKEVTETSLKARIHCLTGCCLSKVGRPQTAVHHFKAALAADFSHSVSLYFIAEQYRQLHLETAELEALNLLILTFENISSTKVNPSVTLEQVVISEVLRLLDIPHTVTLIEVQYLLAVRCLELHRYEVAYQRYIDLLAVISKSDVVQRSGKLIGLPTLYQIYLEAIQTSLRCKRLVECVTLCDKALLSKPQGLITQHSQSSTDDLTATLSNPTGTRKRKHSAAVVDTQQEVVPTCYVTEYLIHKAAAQQLQGELEECAQTLHSALIGLEEKINSELDVGCLAVVSEQQVKRARLSSDFVDTARGADTDNPNPNLLRVYIRLGAICSLQGKRNKAVHYYRLALQIQPDNRTTSYYLTNELFILARIQEAVGCWLESRDINPRMDMYQINREIQTRESKVRKMTSEDKSDSLELRTPSERDVLLQDVQVLKSLLYHKQYHVWKAS